MIADRTEIDVIEAERIRKEKIQKFLPITETERLRLDRGMVTVETLNRIESKQTELKKLINGAGYFNTPIVNKNWTASDVFVSEDLKRIFANDEILRRAFLSYSGTPEAPGARLHWKNFNDLEKILIDIELMISDIKKISKECGDAECMSS